MSTQTDRPCKRMIVLDTSAFVAGYDPFSMSEEQVTVPKVEDEIKRSSVVKVRFETAIESGKVKVKMPTNQSLAELKASATALGDFYKLSETDLQLLALALELKGEGYTPKIVTDDYCIQNVASQSGIGFVSLATFGIKRLLEWVRYCPACHKQYPANCRTKECQICGTELKRKPIRAKKT
jgi:endoribonuclease Nob1